jgi:hypothetical protein
MRMNKLLSEGSLPRWRPAYRIGTKHKFGAFQGGTNPATGKVGWEPSHLKRFDLDDLLARLSRDRIAGVTAVRNVELDGLADVGEDFRMRVSLADTAGQGRDAGDLTTIRFPLQNHHVAHRLLLLSEFVKLFRSDEDG